MLLMQLEIHGKERNLLDIDVDLVKKFYLKKTFPILEIVWQPPWTKHSLFSQGGNYIGLFFRGWGGAKVFPPPKHFDPPHAENFWAFKAYFGNPFLWKQGGKYFQIFFCKKNIFLNLFL
jgi:hypothetical protein